jgi:outer membrane immunogenic protein
MLRRILLVTVGILSAAAPALSADLPSRAPPPVYVPPTPIFTWTGIYLGGQVGYGWGRLDGLVVAPNGGTAGYGYTPQGVIGGAHVGYNWQGGPWVLGIEGSVDGTSLSKSITPGAGVVFSDRSEIQGSIRGRAGIAWDRALLYATGGAAFGGFSATFTSPNGTDTFSSTRVGWTVGGGLAYAITNNWSVYAEYRYSDFGTSNVFPGPSFGNVAGLFVHRHYTQNQVQAGFSYKFDTYAPAPIVSKY